MQGGSAMPKVVHTTCPYCGVGCGVEVKVADGAVTVSGDKQHPANLGRLCSKGTALDQTLDNEGRLLHPIVNGQRATWEGSSSPLPGRRKIPRFFWKPISS